MKRRQFLGWMGTAAAAIGASSVIGWSSPSVDPSFLDEPDDVMPREFMARMNGRACHDFRMMSDDRSLFIDRKMLDV